MFLKNFYFSFIAILKVKRDTYIDNLLYRPEMTLLGTTKKMIQFAVGHSAISDI